MYCRQSNSPVEDSTPKLRTRRSQAGGTPIGSSPLGRETRKSLRISKVKDQNILSPSKNPRPSNDAQKRRSSVDPTDKKSQYDISRNGSECDEYSDLGQTTDGGSERKEKRASLGDASLPQSKRRNSKQQNGEIKQEIVETLTDSIKIEIKSNNSHNMGNGNVPNEMSPQKNMNNQKIPNKLEDNAKEPQLGTLPNILEQSEVTNNEDGMVKNKELKETVILPPLSFTIVCPVEDCR